MTLDELVQDINDELTFSRAMPHTLPTKEIQRIVKIATKYFWDNWRHAVQEKYLVLPKEIFTTPLFKKYRQIQLPECVGFVHGLREPKHGSVFGTIDRDFAEQKFIGSEIFLTPFMGESIVYRTIMFSFLDLTKNLILDTVSYDYNKNNRTIFISGHDPKMDLVATIDRKIDEGDLYEDELFQRYCRAKSKVRLGELLKTFDYKLPGGVTINYTIMIDKAAGELAKVEEMIKGENSPDWIIVDKV